MRLTLSAVIPTRNRPDDLGNAVKSVLSQTRRPDELIVVDQSADNRSSVRVHGLFRGVSGTGLVYIEDTAVAGLVDAKRVGSTRAAGDVVCFLEDDVILDRDYFDQIASGFESHDHMIGCAGIIKNHPRLSPAFVAAHAVFLRGIFRDPRAGMTARALAGDERLLRCDVLSGGVSCWRKEVFERVSFDTINGFHLFEDMEFSTRVVEAFGHHLYINPRARLEHLSSTINRDRQGARQRRKAVEALTFYKKRRHWSGAQYGLLLAMIWWLGEALLQAVSLRSIGPVTGYVGGLVEGLRKPVR